MTDSLILAGFKSMDESLKAIDRDRALLNLPGTGPRRTKSLNKEIITHKQNLNIAASSIKTNIKGASPPVRGLTTLILGKGKEQKARLAECEKKLSGAISDLPAPSDAPAISDLPSDAPDNQEGGNLKSKRRKGNKTKKRKRKRKIKSKSNKTKKFKYKKSIKNKVSKFSKNKRKNK